jgi:hypothetical protein
MLRVDLDSASDGGQQVALVSTNARAGRAGKVTPKVTNTWLPFSRTKPPRARPRQTVRDCELFVNCDGARGGAKLDRGAFRGANYSWPEQDWLHEDRNVRL